MSDAKYLDRTQAKFAREYPRSEGWKCYSIHAFLRGTLYINYLLDYVRENPGVGVKVDAFNEVRTDDMLGVADNSHPVTVGSEWDLKKELDGNNWSGRIVVKWEGQELIYDSFSVVTVEGGHIVITLLATKSNSAMRSFHAELDKYGKVRAKGKANRIRVVNGEDIPLPSVTWEDVILPKGMAQEIRENVDGFFSSRQRYVDMGIPYRRGFLFAGAPGCGKTLTIKALTRSTQAAFFAVQATAEVNDGMVEMAFQEAQRNAPAILIIEDIDRLIKAPKVSLSHFLNIMDGLKAMDGVLVLASCNHPENLDPALLQRPSRFDRVWRFAVPDAIQRKGLLEKRGSRYFSPKALACVAEETSGFSMAYLQEIIVNALIHCAHNDTVPTDKHLLDSLADLKAQRINASKPVEDLDTRENLGFGFQHDDDEAIELVTK
jgi:ATP-dependent Zn protease